MARQRPVSVIVDDRERRSATAAFLERHECVVCHVRRLAVGDYLVDGRWLFERKTLPDLVCSIKQGRLFRQALRLVDSPCDPVLVLEGTSARLDGSGMRWEAIQGALVFVTMFAGLPVLRSRTAEETAATFLFAARQGRSIARGRFSRPGLRPRGKNARQRFLLQGLPSVGPERAARLLKRFSTVEGVITATAEELAEVDGIGEQTARRIRWAVEDERAPYCVGTAGG